MYPNSDLIATHEIIKAMETSLGFSMNMFKDQPTITLLVDHEGRILDANRKAEEFFQENRARLLGQEIQSMFDGDSHDNLCGVFCSHSDEVTSFPTSTDDGRHYFWQIVKIKNKKLESDIYIIKGTDTSTLQKMEELKREREILDQEMEKAQIIQSTLLPREAVPQPLQLENVYLPAAKASGDWFGFHHNPDLQILNLYIGDVTGHGIASSLLTGAIFGAVYSTERICDEALNGQQMDQEQRLLTLALAANRTILQTDSNLAMSMFLMSINLRSGKCYTLNAGHRLPFHFCQEEDKVRMMVGGGEVLGVTSEPTLQVKERQLEDGDVVFLYTDGILENESDEGQRIRSKQLKALIEEKHNNVIALKDSVVKLAKDTWRDAMVEDDVAMLFLKFRKGVS